MIQQFLCSQEISMFSAYKKFGLVMQTLVIQTVQISGRLSYVILITLPFSLMPFRFLIPLLKIYYAGLYDYEPDLSGAMAGAGLAVFIHVLACHL